MFAATRLVTAPKMHLEHLLCDGADLSENHCHLSDSESDSESDNESEKSRKTSEQPITSNSFRLISFKGPACKIWLDL